MVCRVGVWENDILTCTVLCLYVQDQSRFELKDGLGLIHRDWQMRLGCAVKHRKAIPITKETLKQP